MATEIDLLQLQIDGCSSYNLIGQRREQKKIGNFLRSTLTWSPFPRSQDFDHVSIRVK